VAFSGIVDGNTAQAVGDPTVERIRVGEEQLTGQFGSTGSAVRCVPLNDQANGVQVIDTIDSLHTALCTRRLDVGRTPVGDGRLQVVIPVPNWTDYVDAAVSDIARAGGSSCRYHSGSFAFSMTSRLQSTRPGDRRSTAGDVA
jgi:hypothetical protein